MAKISFIGNRPNTPPPLEIGQTYHNASGIASGTGAVSISWTVINNAALSATKDAYITGFFVGSDTNTNAESIKCFAELFFGAFAAGTVHATIGGMGGAQESGMLLHVPAGQAITMRANLYRSVVMPAAITGRAGIRYFTVDVTL